MKTYTEKDMQFYPTPKSLAYKMLSKVDFKFITSVLEPSAGKGDIAEVVKDKFHSMRFRASDYVADIDCIEKDVNCAAILRAKGFRVVANDFLTFNTFKRYDLIIMNPPFIDGDKHLLKALELQKNGGQIVCLLNAETINNAYSNSRKELSNKLKELDAVIDIHKDAFASAERKANVDVALIHINIPRVAEDSDILASLRRSEELKDTEPTINHSLVSENYIEELCKQCRLEMKAGLKLISEYNALSPMLSNSLDKDMGYRKILQLLLTDTGSQRHSSCSSGVHPNNFIRRVRAKYWELLFASNKFTSRLTSDLKYEYLEKIDELAEYDFSEYNIMQTSIDINNKLTKSIEDAIIKLFDEFSYVHAYLGNKNNIHYYNGWKTNKAWKVNKRVIIRLNGFDDYYKDRLALTDMRVVDKLADVEKAFYYLSGELVDNYQSVRKTLEQAQNAEQSRKIEFEFFTVTFYKKGTCHIEFADMKLLQKFNIFGSRKKGWLPPSYCKKAYDSMSKTEQAVVDEFEGKASYNKVFAEKDYYLLDIDSMLMLGYSD